MRGISHTSSPVRQRCSRSAMQCRYCEQNSATRGLRALEVSFHVMLSSASEHSEGGAKRFQIEAVQFELDAHEKQAQAVVDVLVGVQNVGAAFEEKSRHARYQALTIGAIDQQNG